ncbi:MAG TPA: hypothetical protein VJS44_20685 [Pyrinomonadaceae bacterium]|nr:hypothetical protein [Pyrinomonadaceae bacterium]
MRSLLRFLLPGAAALLFSIALSPLVYGQSAQQKMEEAMRSEAERRAGEEERRIAAWELRMAEVRRPPTQRRDATLAYTQIRDDYKQLQVVNNDLARAVDASPTLDLKYIEKSVSEIKKRAARLKENLMLPEGQKPQEVRAKQEIAANPRQMKSSLVVLDNLVMAFVNNSIFDQTKKVDIEQAAKARHALEEIIELSEQIKRCGEKLKNTEQKTQ